MRAWIVLEYDLSDDGDTETLRRIAARLTDWIEEDGLPTPSDIRVEDELSIESGGE